MPGPQETQVSVEEGSSSENVVYGEDPVKDLAHQIKKIFMNPDMLSAINKITDYEIITKVSEDSPKQTGRLFVEFFTGIFQTTAFYTEILPNDNKNGVEIIPGTVYKYKTQMPFKVIDISHVKVLFFKTGQDEGDHIKLDSITFKPLEDDPEGRKAKILRERSYKPIKTVRHGKGMRSMKEINPDKDPIIVIF